MSNTQPSPATCGGKIGPLFKPKSAESTIPSATSQEVIGGEGEFYSKDSCLFDDGKCSDDNAVESVLGAGE
jgi:hypothetical protein